MRPFNTFFCLLSLLIAAPAAAQISVDAVNKNAAKAEFRDSVKRTTVDPSFFNLARYKAERAEIRRERNYLEFGGSVQGTLTSYSDSWIETSGGDNSIAVVGKLWLQHIFTKNLFSVETKVSAMLGYNRMKVETDDDGSEGVWFKNQDELSVSVAPSFKMSKNWSYGAIVKFRSQFVNGYKSRTEQRTEHRKSSFMSPGYLDVSLGVTYKCPKEKWPFVVNLSPLALSGTFVESAEVRRNGYLYGIEDPDKSSKYEGGTSVQIDFDRTFGQKKVIRYRTTLFSFFGWITDIGQKNKYAKYSEFRDAYTAWEADDGNIKTKPVLPIHPTVRWENTIDIKATKFLTTTLNFQLYYNRAQNLNVQTQTLLSVGLSYTFQNKPKP